MPKFFFPSLRAKRSNLSIQKSKSHRYKIASLPGENNQTSVVSQRGNSSVLIILVLIVIFAVMLAGGGSSLFTGNLPSPDNSDLTPSPTISDIIPTPTVSWSLDVKMDSCDKTNALDPKETGTMTVTGPTKGYVFIKTIDSSNKETLQIVTLFSPPKMEAGIALLKSYGFSTNKWIIELYSGGKTINNALGGGTLQKTYNGNPTDCQ